MPWLVHGFSTRLAPHPPVRKQRSDRRDFHLGRAGDASRCRVEANRPLLLAALGGRWTLASLRQIHSAIIYQAVPSHGSLKASGRREMALEYRPAGWPLPQLAPRRVAESTFCGQFPGQLGGEDRDSPAGDALVTAEPDILLSVGAADCLPVLLADVRLRVVAAVHAGWRGALARVIEKTVGEMRRIFGSRPENLVTALGPAIGRCCYEVGDEVVDSFRAQFIQSDDFFYRPPRDPNANHTGSRYLLLFHTQASPGHRRERASLHLDLVAVARAQLRAAGLKASAIHNSGYCTACCADLFFSYRREGAQARRMTAVIGMRPSSRPQLMNPGQPAF